MNKQIINELNRINFEDILWLTFAILSFMNIYGDYCDKEYLKTNKENFKEQATKVFTITLIVTLFIYIYFFIRNYNAYQKASKKEKDLYQIKVLGSSLLIAGIICLVYFQTKQTSFIGSPAI